MKRIARMSSEDGSQRDFEVLTVLSIRQTAPSFVENPVLYVKEDGTRVTNFHDGIAKWAGTSDKKRGTEEWKNAIEKTGVLLFSFLLFLVDFFLVRRYEKELSAHVPVFGAHTDSEVQRKLWTLEEWEKMEKN